MVTRRLNRIFKPDGRALVVACDQPLRGERAYYLVAPLREDEPAALGLFRKWLAGVNP
mgnify:CR=1 FL=1